MAAKVPRERLIGTLLYKKNGFTELLSPNTYPQEIYERHILRLSGIHTKVGTVDGVAVAENPLTLLKAIQVRFGSNAWVDIPGPDLHVLSHYIMQRPGRPAPGLLASTGDKNSDDTFGVDLELPFALKDMVAPRRGFFPANRYTSPAVGLRINWGSESDMVNGGTFSTNQLDSCQVDVIGREWSGQPEFEAAKNYFLHKRISAVTPTNGSALVKYPIEIPRDASRLRGVLIKTYQDSPETPDLTVISDTADLTLIYGTTDRKYEYTYGLLRSINERDYGIALPPGYVFIDLAPDGDFGALQDTTAGLFQILFNTNAVAAAQIRCTFVRYEPGIGFQE